MTIPVVFEGGNADGRILVFELQEHDELAPAFEIKVDGDRYRCGSEVDKEGRRVAVYDG